MSTGENPVSYTHTQRSPLMWILVAVAAVAVIGVWIVSRENATVLISTAVAAIIVLAGLCFGNLTVRDEDEALHVRFGPLPLFRARIWYSSITKVAASRSDVLDGWGIHRIPGRGLIYNVWGFDCVRIDMGKRTIRIGTDDVEGLTGFLRTRVPSSGTVLDS